MSTLQAAPNYTPATPFVRESRIVRASRASVYAAWTEPEILKQWFGGVGRYCPSCSLDVREGGSYRIEVHLQPDVQCANESAARQSTAEGVYTEVVPEERLQFTWKPSWNPGEESLVTVTLSDAAGGTEVVILHEQISSDGAPGYTRGWSGSLAKLDALLAA